MKLGTKQILLNLLLKNVYQLLVIIYILKAFISSTQKKQKEVVLNLNKMGMEIELIAKAVNLSVDEVKKILNM